MAGTLYFLPGNNFCEKRTSNFLFSPPSYFQQKVIPVISGHVTLTTRFVHTVARSAHEKKNDVPSPLSVCAVLCRVCVRARSPATVFYSAEFDRDQSDRSPRRFLASRSARSRRIRSEPRRGCKERREVPRQADLYPDQSRILQRTIRKDARPSAPIVQGRIGEEGREKRQREREPESNAQINIKIVRV